MLSVAKKPIIMSVGMLNTIMVGVIILNVVAPHVTQKKCQGKYQNFQNLQKMFF
jgi:hypothetical protein